LRVVRFCRSPIWLFDKFANLHLGWGSIESLYTSLASNLFSTAISVWKGLCSFLPTSLHALAVGAEKIENVAFAFLRKLLVIPINILLLMRAWNRIVELGGTSPYPLINQNPFSNDAWRNRVCYVHAGGRMIAAATWKQEREHCSTRLKSAWP
jgi:hypothetical protein